MKPFKQSAPFSWQLLPILTSHRALSSGSACLFSACRLLPVVTLLFIAGCGEDPLKSAAAKRLKGLSTMYLDYAAVRGGGPPNEEAFKKHLNTVEKFVVQGNGIDPGAINEAFVSPRDNQPWVILYGVGIGRISGDSAPLVAYEKTGVKGKHLVAFANTKLDHVDENGLKELLAKKQD
jgi:hypothetical protein